MAKKGEKSNELILDQPKLVLPDLKGKLFMKVSLAGFSQFTVEIYNCMKNSKANVYFQYNNKQSAASVEQIYSVNSKQSVSHVGSSSIYGQSNYSGVLCENSGKFQHCLFFLIFKISSIQLTFKFPTEIHSSLA